MIGRLAFTAGLLLATTATAADTPTFTKDVAPIFQEKCEACHRADSMAPMSLVTFEEVRPWARSIRTRVESRQMPPWHIDKKVGIQQFKNDRSLTDAQVDTIVRWVDAGAPKGDPKDMPPPVKWPTEQVWNYAAQFGQSEPDLIVRSPKWTQPARGLDSWWRDLTPTGLAEPRWVRATEIRPATIKGRRITHHAVVYLIQDEPSDDNNDSADAANSGGAFMEWAVGKQGEMARPNTGKLMLPGSSIMWSTHFSSVGEEITDELELGIYFYPKGQEPKYRTKLANFNATRSTGGIDIRPNTVAISQGFTVMKEAGRIESFQPHMHLRGKAMTMEAILPDGTMRVLSHVGNFNFNWHNNYIYADDAAPLLPKGTVVRVTAWHDNTSANKNNPDPTQWVGPGDRTVDEMAHAWVNVTYMNDEDFKEEVARRKAAEGLKTQQQE